MPRNISFALTTEQFKKQSKDITRRFGWKFLKEGDVLNGVEKSMGLKKGEKIKRLGQIRIVSTRMEPLSAITKEDVIREGFPDWTPEQFIDLILKHHKVTTETPINRIEFEYI